MKPPQPRLPRDWRRTYRWVRSGRVAVGDVLHFLDGRLAVVREFEAKFLDPVDRLVCLVFRAPGGRRS